MFTYNERDLHRMPTPARTHLPVREFIKDSGVLDEDSARDNEVCLSFIPVHFISPLPLAFLLLFLMMLMTYFI